MLSPFAMPFHFILNHLQRSSAVKMAYSWDNRVKFVVRFMYDIDNNGFLDKNDFECLAVRNTIIESKGKWDDAKFAKNKEVMANLWNEIAELADFNKVQIDRDCQSMRHLHLQVLNQQKLASYKEGLMRVCS